jgi:hypothetical protein
VRTLALHVLMFPFLAFPSLCPGADNPRPHYAERWVYTMPNLLVDRSVSDLLALIERAGRSGYTGIVIADYKFNTLHLMPEHYFRNVARVRQAAEAAKLEIIPAVFPIGYSAGLLAHDPNLAEGLPVRDAPFVVRGREAVLVPDPAAHLRNGDLEQVAGHRFVGFSLQDDPGQSSFADRKVVYHGRVSCRMQDVGKVNTHGHCRLSQHVRVRPHACYRLSCWVKTEDFRPGGAFRLLALGKDGRPLSFYEGQLPTTADWAPLSVVFNSLEERDVQVYAGQWGGQSGTLWLDDLKLEELSLVNVLRRPGCPLVVASADGRTVYQEGQDYEAVRDPRLGQEPYAGEYSFNHPVPTLRLTEGTRIRDGQRLRVSWYHPVLTHDTQVMCCLSEPKVYDVLRDQARRVNELFHPRTFFMSHDEIRVAGWCRACQRSGMTPGELLAENARRCVEILKAINPQARVAVWSDMFDPHHNAVDHYYLVNGSFAGSWNGLPADVIIANWNSGKAALSLKWFADRGHPQVLAGYYDSGLDNLRHWEAAARGVPKVMGLMYTTWQQRYQDLEAYGRALRGSQ